MKHTLLPDHKHQNEAKLCEEPMVRHNTRGILTKQVTVSSEEPAATALKRESGLRQELPKIFHNCPL
ncbi:MAG: hypothetical protein GX589_06805 [Deltaproteobacteria bacterium]|nr:hypothetical protein [Deltaproteobacteria bacterium]